MMTVTLDPKVWYRGQDSEGSALLNYDKAGNRQQCCLGIAATAAGVPDDVLIGMGELQRSRVVAALPANGPLLAMVRAALAGDGALLNTYTENDLENGAIGDDDRVAAINEQTEPFGLRFVLG